MATHTVKSWAHFFDAIRAGRKLHDLRIVFPTIPTKNDPRRRG